MNLKQKARKRFGQQPAGFILVLTLVFAALLGVASVLAIGPSVGEALKSGQELRDKRLFFLADGGATLCRGELKNRLNVALPTKLAGITSLGSFDSRYVTGNDPALFLVENAYDLTNPALLGGDWIKDSATQVHVQPSYGQYQCTLTVTSRSAPVGQLSVVGIPVLFHYRYAITGTGSEGGVTRTVTLEGTFSVLVQQENFARYALFTNSQGGIYFAQGFNYYGPVHTNGEFNFMQNPGAHFWDTIESVAPKAKYGNSPGSPIELTKGVDPVYDHNGTIDVPIFDKPLNLGAANIAMPSTTTGDTQKTIALTGFSGSTMTNGVYLAYNSGAMTGGIYVKGDASMTLSVPSAGIAQYSITQGADTWTVQLDKASNQTKIKKNSGSYTTYTGLPNGMLFVDGRVTGLAGTLQKDTQLTVAASSDVTITGNLLYEMYFPASGGSPLKAEGTTNLMGILPWSNSIHIGTSAPNDVNIHATLMAPVGQVLVDSFDDTGRGPRGTATILGGVIQDSYGAFALSSGGSIISGYARNFIYDKRMSQGMAPPYFPTTGKVIGTVTGITDRPNWQQTN
jgi:hypothetical protein